MSSENHDHHVTPGRITRIRLLASDLWSNKAMYWEILTSILIVMGYDLAGTIFSLIVLILAWPFFLLWLWPYIQQSAIQSLWTRLAIVAVLVIIAGLLYLIRTYRLTIYGLAEVIIGTATCWAVLSKGQETGLVKGTALAGAVYVMVRGFDNYITGRRKEIEKKNKAMEAAA